MCQLAMKRMGRPRGLKMSDAAKAKISLRVKERWRIQKELDKLDKDKNLLIPSQVSNTIEVK